MTSAIVAESKINEAIQFATQKGFKLVPGRFGDERCGCMFQALALMFGDRKYGESVKELACRHFEVDDKCIWAAVAGFDGKHTTSKLYEDWYDMGHRIAGRWRVHERT